MAVPHVWDRVRWAGLQTTAAGGSAARPLDSRLKALGATRQFAQCSDSELRSLLAYVDEVAVNAGRRVAREGEPCHQFVIVMEGRLCSHSDSGTERTLPAGSSYGWTPMRERGVNDATVVAESDTRLLVMSHAQFRAAISAAKDSSPLVGRLGGGDHVCTTARPPTTSPV